LGLGVTLTDWPQLLTPAEWVGEEGVAFWLAGVNGMAASAVVGTRSGHGVGRWLLVGGAILVPSVLGLVRARSLQLDPGPTVMVIGTHVSPALRARPEDAGRETLRQIEDALGQTDPGSVDILALPEATIPFPLQAVQARPSMEALESLVDRLRVPVVFGALGRGVGGGRDTAVTNSAYLLSPGGSRIQRYDKRQLVPGMEAGAYEKGRGPGILEAGEWNLGLLVCYESLFSGSAREARRAGADLLVNLSSDIWFGQEGSFLGSLFLHQHPEHLVLRAVENRMPVARAANGGFSLLLDPLGRAASETVSPGGGATQAKVPVFRGRTLFSVIGDWVGPGSLLFGLFVLLGRWRKAGAGGPSKAR
jgi:apolipoprotein N-acyltransferase